MSHQPSHFFSSSNLSPRCSHEPPTYLLELEYLIPSINEVALSEGEFQCGHLIKGNSIKGSTNILCATALTVDAEEHFFVLSILPLHTKEESNTALEMIIDISALHHIHIPFYCADEASCNPDAFDYMKLPSFHHRILGIVDRIKLNLYMEIDGE